MQSCPFCRVDQARVIHETEHTLALWDAFPVSPGHALIIPRRHIPSWTDASPDERRELTDAIAVVRALIDERHRPAGYNIGFNDGPAAGQTVMHLHIHVIPRYPGDVPDPRGGVRWVLPEKARCWEAGGE
jgi:diadenosine tetraphosphate (Ap4A) HIT family hydrolase